MSVLLLILEWNVDWLVQQQKNPDPPPISRVYKKVGNKYDGIKEYYNTYLPLMLLETWQRIYVSWTHLHQISPFFCEITSYKVEESSINVECQAIFKASDAAKALFPEEGSIIMIKFGTKEKGGIKILGYVKNVKIRNYNPALDSMMAFKAIKCAPEDLLQTLNINFIGAYNSDDFDKKQLIRIQVLCNVKSTLKQNDAMLNIEKSPLYMNTLNPLSDGLRTVTVVTRNPDPLMVTDKVVECVKDILKGIASPHPLPLLTIAKSLPSSDRLLVLPPLIEKMKQHYKTKVLICTRTVKALSDIGFNLEGGTAKLVILAKRADIHQKLRRHLLDDQAASKLRSTRSDVSEDDFSFESLSQNKVSILRNCDVLLTLIKDSHSSLLAEAFSDTEIVSQMCCIVDEANLCTEPEILIPLLFGISKLILIGDPEVHAKVCSKAATAYGYNRSLFHRAYEMDLVSEE